MDYLARFAAFISALAVSSIIVVICVSVFMRRVASTPLYYGEELVGLLLSVTMMCALPLVTKRGAHIRVTLVVNYLSERGQALMALFAILVSLTFFLWMLWEAVPWMEFAMRLDIKSEVAAIPLVPWMMVFPAMFSLTALILAVQFLRNLAQILLGGPQDHGTQTGGHN
nr:TRAP transporter small permease [Pseudovibrio flavus]